jgi:hypothetical protein
MQYYQSGARRNTRLTARYDLIPHGPLRRLAETFAEGASKHGERNWEKGMAVSDLLNHAIDHLLAWSAGDRGEDHLGHAAWNILAIMHFEETRPELIDTKTPQYTARRSRLACWSEPPDFIAEQNQRTSEEMNQIRQQIIRPGE